MHKTEPNDFEKWLKCLRSKNLDKFEMASENRSNIIHSISDITIHYRDNDIFELYRAHQKIVKLISYVKNQYESNRKNPTWDIIQLREFCQNWINGVTFRQDLPADRTYVVDMAKYFFKGQYNARLRWRKVFYCVICDIINKLNEIDGGPNNQDSENISYHNNSKIGFM